MHNLPKCFYFKKKCNNQTHQKRALIKLLDNFEKRASFLPSFKRKSSKKWEIFVSQASETYKRPYQTSIMEYLKLLFFSQKKSIVNVWQGVRNTPESPTKKNKWENNLTESFSGKNFSPQLFQRTSTALKKDFRLTKICEKDRKDHIFVSFRMFPFDGNIIFSELSFKRKWKKAASFRKCVFLRKCEILV